MLYCTIPTPGWRRIALRDADDAETMDFLAGARSVQDVPGVMFLEPEPGRERFAAIEFPANCTGLMPFGVDLGDAWERTPPVSNPWKLYPHQLASVQAIVRMGHGLLAYPMGLGKTRAAAAAADLLAQDGGVIILAPRFTRLTWRRELEQVGLLRDESEWFEARGTSGRGGIPAEARWMFVHYEVATAWQHVFRWAKHKPRVLICDEAHWVKNAKTKRGQAAHVLRQSHTIALTGTPLPNRPSELHSIAELVTGPKTWGSFFDFRRRYCGAYRDEHGWRDGAPTMAEELRARLEGIYHRPSIEETGLELPPIRRQRLDVALSPEDHARIVKVLNGVSYQRLYEALLSGAMKEDTLATISRLRKLTSAAKLPTTADHIASCMMQGESVVAFTWLRETADKLATALRRRFPDGDVITIHGGIPQAQRDEQVQAWQARAGLEVPGTIVATIDALKEGVTLTRARNVVLHDYSWVPTDSLQAEARVHRISQSSSVLSAWAVQQESIDELILQAFARKAMAQSDVLGFGATKEALQELGVMRADDDGFGWLRDMAAQVAEGFR